MTVEPITDAELAMIEHQIAEWRDTPRSDRKPLLWSPATVNPLVARVRAAEAARDAALARAIPEPRLMRTAEDVEALPEGRYFVHNENQRTVVLDRFLAFDGNPIWLQLGGQGCWRDPEWIVGRPVAGPLPALPIPTQAQEPTDDR